MYRYKMLKAKVAIPTVLIVLLFWLLISLGQWQLRRADEKRQLEAAINAAQSNPAKQVYTKDDILAKEHYPVLLQGHFDNEKQFIYDNQIVKSTAGYYVLTPFIIKQNNNVILVNRGFVPWQGNRDKITDISVSTKEQTIKVTLTQHIQRKLLKEQKVSLPYPVLIQTINLTTLNNLTGYYIIPMLALLDKQEKQGFYRDWPPYYGSVEKHMGYAIQWFAMAFVLFIIALKMAYKNRKIIF